MFRRPTGFKIDLKTDGYSARRLKDIPCSRRTVESKNLFQKTEHKSCCKHDTFGTGILFACHQLPSSGRDGRRLGFLGADSEEKHEPASDIDTMVVDSLKALDPRRPIEKRTSVDRSELAGSCLGSLASHFLGHG
jgi:hypothetical protein